MTSIIKVDQIQKANGGTPTAADLGINTTGTVLQTVQSTNGTRGSVTSTSYTSTPITATITPTSSTSKVLVRAVFLYSQVRSSAISQDHMKSFTLYRGGTNIAPHNSRFFAHQNEVGDGESTNFGEQCQEAVIEFLDSPSTTNATTYTVYCKCDSTAITITINGRGASSGFEGSNITTLQEIAG